MKDQYLKVFQEVSEGRVFDRSRQFAVETVR